MLQCSEVVGWRVAWARSSPSHSRRAGRARQRWPSTLPSIFTALRIATGTVVAVLFFVESIGARYGIGFYILDAWGRADIPQIYAGILVLAAMGVILYETFDILERVYCRWSQL